MIRHATPEHDCHKGCQLTNSILKNRNKNYNHFSNASLSTDGPSNQHNIRLSSRRHQLRKSGATDSLGQPIVISESTLVRTSFKNGKMTNVEAASQNRRRRRIYIWERGSGVYSVDDLLLPTIEDIFQLWGIPGGAVVGCDIYRSTAHCKYLCIGARVYYVAGKVQEHRTGNVGVMGMHLECVGDGPMAICGFPINRRYLI